MIAASAPGKLMLAGEYAVVSGAAPALAVALGVRASVELIPGGGRWRVTSEAYDLVEAPAAAVPVVDAALRWCRPFDSGHLVIRSDLGAGPSKPGFGSSAAVAVATAGVLRASVDAAAPTVAEVVAIHRAAQGGRGSGYDVATALLGGVCVFDRRDADAPSAHATQWVRGLHAAVIFTGSGASSSRHLRRLEEAAGASGFGDAMERHALASAALVRAWHTGDPVAVLECCRGAERSLAELDRAGDLGIGGGGQRGAREAIEAAGAVARTSGAGGGDCLWALASDAATLRAAVEAAARAGFAELDVGLSAVVPAGAGLTVKRGS